MPSFILFPLTFVCGTLVFCLHVEWRRSWRILAIPAFVIVCGLIYDPLTIWADSVENVSSLLVRALYYICCSVMFVAILRCCTRLTWLESLVTVVAGYAVQHLAVDVYALIDDTGWAQRNPDGPLERFMTDFLGVFIIVYALTYACIGRRRVVDDGKIRNRLVWVLVCAGILLFVITFSMLVVEDRSLETRLVGHIYDAICVALMLAVLMLVAANDRLYGDLAALRQTEQLARQHYEIARENIDLINIRCHDIRKSISRMADNRADTTTGDLLRQVEGNIRIYDSIFHTGNEYLDVLLTEKGLYCSGNAITFTCVADGRRLGFMDDTDVFELFSNILDNAIESAARMQEPGKRVVNLGVEANGGLLVIRSENYYPNTDVPKFSDGMPVTTKTDHRQHGFGTRSIAWQARKYNGEASFQASDGVYTVTVVVPIP